MRQEILTHILALSRLSVLPSQAHNAYQSTLRVLQYRKAGIMLTIVWMETALISFPDHAQSRKGSSHF